MERTIRPSRVGLVIAIAATLWLPLETTAQPSVTCGVGAIEWVPIGDPGNLADSEVMGDGTTGYGSVAYVYEIMKYEATNSQYAEFLNAVAKTDTYTLYHPGMATPPDGGIVQAGVSGAFTYAVIPGFECMPVAFVSWVNSFRFANWMHNGRPTGPQGAATTEDGAYTITLPKTVGPRKPGATAFLTSENEWYKAAYYDPATQTYWDYPTGSNAAPTCADPPGLLPNSANCVSMVPGCSSSCPNALCTNDVYEGAAPVGSYATSPSAYGTFDQAGNLWEWNETLFEARPVASIVGQRGGGFIHCGHLMHAATRPDLNEFGRRAWGFRLARQPQSCLLPNPGDL